MIRHFNLSGRLVQIGKLKCSEAIFFCDVTIAVANTECNKTLTTLSTAVPILGYDIILLSLEYSPLLKVLSSVQSLLQVCLRFYEHEFVELACQCPAVVVCRCSPTQKAAIVTLLKQHTGEHYQQFISALG